MGDIGETLRLERESRGLSIEQAALDTRISAPFIEALEAEDFDALPAPVYVRGFLRSYANYLQLDPQPLLDALSDMEPTVAAAATPIAQPPATDPFATAPRPKAGYEEIPQAPAPTMADSGDQWWPEDDMTTERATWPEAAPREPVAVREAPVAAPLTAALGTSEVERATVAAREPGAPRVAHEHERLKRLRDTGILVDPDDERPRRDAAAGRGSSTRMIVIAGAAVFGLVAIVVAAFSLMGGGAGTNVAADGEPTEESDQVLAAGDATPRTSATARISVTPRPSTTPNPRTPTATASSTPEATEEPEEEPTTAARQPTTKPSGSGGTTPGGNTSNDDPPTRAPATQVPPTKAPAQPSNTPPPPPPPPTSTPKPPTAVPTATQIPVPVHGSGLGECPRDGAAVNCGSPDYAIVCAPGGWFLDYGQNFTNPRGWPVYYVDSPLKGSGVC